MKHYSITFWVYNDSRNQTATVYADSPESARQLAYRNHRALAVLSVEVL